jgi:PTH1 family peptidyl-tRNA hydrolase
MQELQRTVLKFVEWVQSNNPPKASMPKLIVGLGNPGKRYEWTRHNLGWLALDALKEKHDPQAQWKNHAKAKALVCELSLDGKRVILMKPQTFMNDSGKAIRAFLDFHKSSLADILVLYDEADLDFGKLKITQQGGSAGHNGIKSIISEVKTDQFLRIRLGIKNKKKDKIPTDKFVLQPFGLFEKRHVKKWLTKITSAIECLFQEDQIETCMNRFH